MSLPYEGGMGGREAAVWLSGPAKTIFQPVIIYAFVLSDETWALDSGNRSSDPF